MVNWGTSMQVAPTTSAVWMPMPSPKPWKMGITESIFMPCRSV